MPEAGGYSNTTIGRSAPAAISEKWRSTMSGLSWAPHMKSVGGKTSTPAAPAARAARQVDGVLRAVGVDARDDRAGGADLVERDRERAPSLLAIERRHFVGMAVGDDAGDAARVGEPAEVAAVCGLVDRQIRREGQHVGGHDAREAQRFLHGGLLTTATVASTQMSVIVPVTTSEVTFRARRAGGPPSSAAPSSRGPGGEGRRGRSARPARARSDTG